MTRCPACGSDSIGISVEPGCGPVRTCNDCGREVPPDQETEAAPRVAVRRPTTGRARAESPASGAPENPVPAMRRRLRWLDGEIRRLRKLEAEREQLSRILSAASGKPVAVVRELRSSRG